MGKKNRGNRGRGGPGPTGGGGGSGVVAATTTPPQQPANQEPRQPEANSKPQLDQQSELVVEIPKVEASNQVQQTQSNVKIDEIAVEKTSDIPGNCTELKIAGKVSECQDEERPANVQIPKDAIATAVPNNVTSGTAKKKNKNNNNKTKNAPVVVSQGAPTTSGVPMKRDIEDKTTAPTMEIHVDGNQTLSNRQKKKLKRMQEEEERINRESSKTTDDNSKAEADKKECTAHVSPKAEETIIPMDINEKAKTEENNQPEAKDIPKKQPDTNKEEISAGKPKKQKGKDQQGEVPPFNSSTHQENTIKEGIPLEKEEDQGSQDTKTTEPIAMQEDGGTTDNKPIEDLPVDENIQKNSDPKVQLESTISKEAGEISISRPSDETQIRCIEGKSKIHHEKKTVKKGHCPYEHPKEPSPRSVTKDQPIIAADQQPKTCENSPQEVISVKIEKEESKLLEEESTTEKTNNQSNESSLSGTPEVQTPKPMNVPKGHPNQGQGNAANSASLQTGNKKHEKQKNKKSPNKKMEQEIELLPQKVIKDDAKEDGNVPNLLDSVCLVGSLIGESKISDLKDDSKPEHSGSLTTLKTHNYSLESMTDSTTTDITVVVEKSLENISNVPDEEIMKLFNIVSKEFEKSPEPTTAKPTETPVQEPMQQAGEALANLIDVVVKTESKIKEGIAETRRQMKSNKSKKSKSKTPDKSTPPTASKKEKDLLKDVIVVDKTDCVSLPEEPGDPPHHPVGDPPPKKSQSPDSVDGSKKSPSRKLSTDSKNGQRSDFVQSVEEQQQNGAKSLLKIETNPVFPNDLKEVEEVVENKSMEKDATVPIQAQSPKELERLESNDKFVKLDSVLKSPNENIKGIGKGMEKRNCSGNDKSKDQKTNLNFKEQPANEMLKPVSLNMILKPDVEKKDKDADIVVEALTVQNPIEQIGDHATTENKIIEQDYNAKSIPEEKPTLEQNPPPTEEILNSGKNEPCTTLITPISSVTEPKDSPLQPVKDTKGNNKKSKSPAKNQKPNKILNGFSGAQQSTSSQPKIPPRPEHTKNKQTKTIAKVQNPITIAEPSDEDDEEDEEYIEYKFSPRKVFLFNLCHVCQKILNEKCFLCPNCKMIAYCDPKHCEEDQANHRDYCRAIQDVAKKRGGHVYNNARVLSPNEFRNLRVHTLNICCTSLKRPLQAFEKEILLFPRLCAKTECRNWRVEELENCPKCHQVAYCKSNPEHVSEGHQKWCEIFKLYQLLVLQTSRLGRIEPAMPSAILTQPIKLPMVMDDLFKSLYGGPVRDPCLKVVLSQLATGPLTALNAAISVAKLTIGETFVVHLIGAELQFEGDTLDKWEAFFLHLVPGLTELRVVFVGPELNVENLPVEILSRIR